MVPLGKINVDPRVYDITMSITSVLIQESNVKYLKEEMNFFFYFTGSVETYTIMWTVKSN